MRTQELLQLCNDLSIAINWEKLDVEPKQRMKYVEKLIATKGERLHSGLLHQQVVGGFNIVFRSARLFSAVAVDPCPLGFNGEDSSSSLRMQTILW